MDYDIKSCDEAQLPEILEMFNDAIINTTSVYDYLPRTVEFMTEWYNSKLKGHYGPFRSRPAYKYSVEHSIYVRHDKRGKGYGKILLQEIINSAMKDNYHVLIGGIDADNKISIRFHENMGFEYAGTIKHAGYKFGKWLDLTFYQLILKTPINPIEE
jgi:phosphinothricin acetyltransferase